MIVLDTGALYAALVETEVHHEACRDALLAEPAPLLLSPFVLCELDYLTATRLGVDVELDVLDEVARGAYQLEPFGDADIADARRIVAQYRDLGIGLADASLVVLAARYGVDRILTLDERHFRSLRTREGGAFTLVPADA
ncbi:MAG TPA: PIN domain-containing protein [Gaiellaceae bacterium]